MKKERNELKDLKQFGLALAGILLVIGAVNFMKGRMPWCWRLSGLGLIVIALVLAAPKTLKPVYKIFTKIAHAIGWVNTRVILILIYFIILTPIALVMKIFGKDLLNIYKESPSYWVKRSVAKPSKESLEKQF